MDSPAPFVFCTACRLVELTGLRAKSLAELASILRQVPGSSIFYHTHYQYLSHHFEKPLFHNDFSLWVGQALQEARLAEELAAIDLLSFTSLRQLREALIATIERHIETSGHPPRECPPGNELHLCKSRSFIMPTGATAAAAADFFAKVPGLTNSSLYFHFFEARLRLERPTNDFSAWLSAAGHEKIARAIDRLDPYVLTLDELKMEIVKVGNKYLGGSDGPHPAAL
ncbi:MAG TPA: DUF5752 family protein [Bryobacterales bacterium]|nr:DUF5752 family protein [Bryobacterales bacterium]